VRRTIAFRGRQQQLAHHIELNATASDEVADETFDDDMLRLIFTCCHPSFAAEVQCADIADGVWLDHRTGRASLPRERGSDVATAGPR
jgi:predicted RNA polymerase sigma factor